MTAHPLVRYLALVLLLLCGLMLSSASLAQSAPRVELALVNREPIYTETNLVGTVNSLEDALLSASVAGLIVQVAVNPGDHVSKGDTLIAL
ncbi:MAG: biotin/lipoyl-binding protein, partial [Halomonas venusta]|nr:biotin/lipoyl-binding protein [Halomonas venusta]